jgi:hypothetical protein
MGSARRRCGELAVWRRKARFAITANSLINGALLALGSIAMIAWPRQVSAFLSGVYLNAHETLTRPSRAIPGTSQQSKRPQICASNQTTGRCRSSDRECCRFCGRSHISANSRKIDGSHLESTGFGVGPTHATTRHSERGMVRKVEAPRRVQISSPRLYCSGIATTLRWCWSPLLYLLDVVEHPALVVERSERAVEAEDREETQRWSKLFVFAGVASSS